MYSNPQKGSQELFPESLFWLRMIRSHLFNAARCNSGNDFAAVIPAGGYRKAAAEIQCADLPLRGILIVYVLIIRANRIAQLCYKLCKLLAYIL